MKNKLAYFGILIVTIVCFLPQVYSDDGSWEEEAQEEVLAPEQIQTKTDLPEILTPAPEVPPQESEQTLRRKAFFLDLNQGAFALRNELVKLPTAEEKQKRVEEYKQETAQRIHEFMASEKSSAQT